MSAHFLLSPACRTLTLAQVARMSEDQAWQAFCNIRWAATQGHPVCPRCTCRAHYARPARRKWICKKCGSEFSVTAGTILADRKMSFCHLLLAIYLFVNAVKGLPALQLSRELGCDYKVAFVLLQAKPLASLRADEGAAFDELHARYVMARINHEEAYSRDGACVNQAESFFSRMRRAEIGIHHAISGLYLRRYAAEMSWREDLRMRDNSQLTSQVIRLAMGRGHSVDWRGYWRRWEHEGAA
jgi:transposase-like protein